MAEIRLTTTQSIVKNTPMGGNVGTDMYIFLIDDMQLMVLAPVLGTKLYDKIQADFNTNSLAGIYLQMHTDYIVPFLDRAIFADYTTNGSYRSRNNGNLKASPDNAETMSKDEDIKFMKHTMNKADFFLNRLERFLNVKGSEIPEYLTQDNDYDTEPSDNEGYNITWKL